MKIFAKSAKATSACLTALLLVINLPLSVMAEAVATSPSPASSTTTQKPPTTYTYNPTTGHWDTNEWYYDALTGVYKAIPRPAVVATQSTVTTAPTVVTTQSDTQAQTPSSTVSQLNADNRTNATNNVDSTAETGNATVILNTAAGNAITGNAASTATILNDVNSVLSMADNQKAASFVADVMGDVNGDILLQPMILKAMLESGGTGSSNGTTYVASVSNTNNLTNNVDLSAASGNAGVIGNTQAGNATSGSANTVANVVNIINSMVAANKSFVGTINIYGNLKGDILIAPNFLSQLIASNGSNGSDASKTATVFNVDNIQSIVNNISLAAESGKAAVMDNTKAGSAVSGDSSTNVVIFNLSGHEVVASDSLLVFVNVLGKWVGVIVDAPAGATAAALGNGVTENSVTSPDLTIISNSNNLITNNINLSSQSGNATVAANTLAGNAVSGNVTSSANIANIANSQFGLTGWFGVLFINVFGNWYGSFGINTPYGNPAVNKAKMRAIEFIPSSGKQASDVVLISNNNNEGYSAVTTNTNSTNSGSIIGAEKQRNSTPIVNSSKNSNISGGINLPLLGGSIFLTLISAAGLRRSVFDRKSRLAAIRFFR